MKKSPNYVFDARENKKPAERVFCFSRRKNLPRRTKMRKVLHLSQQTRRIITRLRDYYLRVQTRKVLHLRLQAVAVTRRYETGFTVGCIGGIDGSAVTGVDVRAEHGMTALLKVYADVVVSAA